MLGLFDKKPHKSFDENQSNYSEFRKSLIKNQTKIITDDEEVIYKFLENEIQRAANSVLNNHYRRSYELSYQNFSYVKTFKIENLEYKFNLTKSEFESIMYKFGSERGLKVNVGKFAVFCDSGTELGVVFEW